MGSSVIRSSPEHNAAGIETLVQMINARLRAKEQENLGST